MTDPRAGFRWATTRDRWSFEDYLERLERAHPGYRYGFEPGRSLVRVWRSPAGSSTRSAVAFVDPDGYVFRADSWKKRGRQLGHVSSMVQHAARDPRRHASRSCHVCPSRRRRVRRTRRYAS